MAAGEPVNVVLALGSNCGDRRKNIHEAIRWLEGQLSLMTVSDIYETPAEGKTAGGCNYVNAVAAGLCLMDPEDLNRRLKEYEFLSGRDEKCRACGDVPIDIDIVVVNGVVIRQRDFDSLYFRIGYSSIFFGSEI